MAVPPSQSNGGIVWLGLTERPLYPQNENSPIREEIALIRIIKSNTYKEDIGYMYFSIDPVNFGKQVFSWDPGSMDITNSSRIFLIDNNGLIINKADASSDLSWMPDVLDGDPELLTQGHLVEEIDSIVYVHSLAEPGWKIVGILPNKSLSVDLRTILIQSTIVILSCIFVCLAVWNFASIRIFRPLQDLANTMKQIEGGNTTQRILVKSDDEIGQLGRNLNRMLSQLETLHAQNLDKEIRVRDAEYRVLQSQINPHFLYNTLNTVRLMAIMIQANNIKRVVDAFWIITKYCTDNSDRFVKIKDEIKITEQYIQLQKIAYPNRFDVVWNVDNSVLTKQCIKFLLQPLVENSLIHGILAKPDEHGKIYINIFIEENRLIINVFDNGVGIDAQTIKNILSANWGRQNRKAGLSNVVERIRYAYDKNHSIDISSEIGIYTNIMIVIPLIENAPKIGKDERKKKEIEQN